MNDLAHNAKFGPIKVFKINKIVFHWDQTKRGNVRVSKYKLEN